MSCPPTEKWTALSAELLSPSESAELRRHAAECDRCARLLLAARRDQATLVRSFEVFDREHDALREHLMAVLPDTVPAAHEAPGEHPRRHRPGVITMSIRNHKARWAAMTLAPAACIVLAVVALMSTGSGPAFADVLERIRQARTMVCAVEVSSRVVQRLPAMGDEVESERVLSASEARGTLSMYTDGACQARRHDVTEYVQSVETADSLVAPYTEWSLPGRTVVRKADGRVEVTEYSADGATARASARSADRWLRRMLDVCERPDRDLGERIIDGREAVGFEIEGWRLGLGAPRRADTHGEASDSWVRLWVDVRTGMPVRAEMRQVSVTVAGRMVWDILWDRMEWNVPLDRADFEPPPPTSPEDVRQADVPAPSEEAFIQAVLDWRAEAQRVADLLATVEEGPQAEYLRSLTRPNDPNPPLEVNELVAIAAARRAGLVAHQRSRRAAHGEEAQVPPAEDGEMPSFIAIRLFFDRLVTDGCEPVYDPAAVGPDKPLLRWRVDEGRQRVIYGDLSVETVPLAP